MDEKKKRRRKNPTAKAERIFDFTLDILSNIVSGLLTAAIIKMIGW